MVGERHNVAFLVGIIAGAAASAVGTLFFTPLSGTETRQQLAARLAALRGTGGAADPLTPIVIVEPVASGDLAALRPIPLPRRTTEGDPDALTPTPLPRRTTEGDPDAVRPIPLPERQEGGDPNAPTPTVTVERADDPHR